MTMIDWIWNPKIKPILEFVWMVCMIFWVVKLEIRVKKLENKE